MNNLPQSFAELAREYENQLPPVDAWSPELNGDLDMRIDREGRWYYQGELVRREALVKLFSSIIKYEGGQYFLVTPVEKWRIKVDVAPFLVVSAKEIDGVLLFTTNVGNKFPLSAEHPLEVTEDSQGHPLPIVKAQRQLEALVSRPVFYQLAELSEIREMPEGDVMVVRSGVDEFILGNC